jgi:hypothetical protein
MEHSIQSYDECGPLITKASFKLTLYRIARTRRCDTVRIHGQAFRYRRPGRFRGSHLCGSGGGDPDAAAQRAERFRSSLVCTENLIRIDCVTESPNVSGDDRAALLLPDPVGLAIQVEEPT